MEATEVRESRPLDWLYRCCDPESRYDFRSPRTLNVCETTYTVACDGRVFVAIAQDHGYPPVQNSESVRTFAKIIEPIATSGYEHYKTTWEKFREFIGPAHELSKVKCKECRGMGEVECNYGHDHECPDCDGTGEVDFYPKRRPVKVGHLLFSAALVAETMADCPAGPMRLYLRKTLAPVNGPFEPRVAMFLKSDGRVVAVMDLQQSELDREQHDAPAFALTT